MEEGSGIRFGKLTRKDDGGRKRRLTAEERERGDMKGQEERERNEND